MDLVTGGCGFIGRHLCKRLLADGRKVRVLDRLIDLPHDPKQRKRRNGRHLHKLGVDVVVADVRDEDAVRDALRGVRRVFHLAALGGVRESTIDPSETLSTAVQGTQVLLTAMSAARTPRLIAASSSSVYGEPPGRASQESDPLEPCSPYGASKVATEALTIAWQRQDPDQRRLALVRPFCVYGPHMRPSMAVYKFLSACGQAGEVSLIGGGAQKRHWTYIDDAVEVFLRAASSKERRLIVNAVGSEQTTVVELLRRCGQVVGPRPRTSVLPPHPGEARDTWGSRQKAETMLGMPQPVDLDSGLRRTWEWMQTLDDHS